MHNPIKFSFGEPLFFKKLISEFYFLFSPFSTRFYVPLMHKILLFNFTFPWIE